MTPFELNSEATRLMREFRVSEALVLQQRACEMARSEGVDPVNYAALVSNLALLHRQLGSYAEAESAYAEALNVMRTAGAGYESNVAQVANNLGVLVGRQGRYEESLALLEESAAIRRERDDHLGLAETCVNLASLHAASLEPDRAAMCLRDAVRECEVVTERPPVNLAAVLEAVPGLQEILGGDDAPLARTNERRMTDLLATGAPDPGKAGDVLVAIGQMARELGELAVAEQAVRRALQMRRIVHGDEHPAIASALGLLGDICQESGDLDAAEALHRGAVEIAVAAFGDDHPQTDKMRFGLAGLHFARRQLAEAESLYRTIATHMRAVSDDSRAALAGVLNNIAEVQILTDRHCDARVLQLEALALYRASLGDRHPAIGTVLHNLGKTAMALGDMTQAERTLREALQVTRAAVGPEHPDVHRTLKSLAILLAATNRSEEALKLMVQATQVSERMIEATSSISSSRRRLAFLWDINRELSTVVSLVGAQLSDSAEARRCALDLVLRRKARDLDATAAQRAAVHRGRHPGLEASLRRLDRMRSELAAASLGIGSTPGEGAPSGRRCGGWPLTRTSLRPSSAPLSRRRTRPGLTRSRPRPWPRRCPATRRWSRSWRTDPAPSTLPSSRNGARGGTQRSR